MAHRTRQRPRAAGRVRVIQETAGCTVSVGTEENGFGPLRRGDRSLHAASLAADRRSLLSALDVPPSLAKHIARQPEIPRPGTLLSLLHVNAPSLAGHSVRSTKIPVPAAAAQTSISALPLRFRQAHRRVLYLDALATSCKDHRR